MHERDDQEYDQFLPPAGVAVHPRAFRHSVHEVLNAARHVGDAFDYSTRYLFTLLVHDRCRLLPVDRRLTLLFHLLQVMLPDFCDYF